MTLAYCLICSCTFCAHALCASAACAVRDLEPTFCSTCSHNLCSVAFWSLSLLCTVTLFPSWLASCLCAASCPFLTVCTACAHAVVSLSVKHCVEFAGWIGLASLAENANSISSCGACKCALFASNPFMISKLTSSVAGLPVVNSDPHSLLCLSSCQLVASGEA